MGNVQNFLIRDFLGNKELKKIMEQNIEKQNCFDKKIKDLERLLEQQKMEFIEERLELKRKIAAQDLHREGVLDL